MTSVSPLREVSNDGCVYPHCTAHLLGKYPTKPAHVVDARFMMLRTGYIEIPHHVSVSGMLYGVRLPDSSKKDAGIRYFSSMPDNGSARVAVLDLPGDEGPMNYDPWTEVVAMELNGEWRQAVPVRSLRSVEVEF